MVPGPDPEGFELLVGDLGGVLGVLPAVEAFFGEGAVAAFVGLEALDAVLVPGDG
ncbi:hypothetical protein Sme01_74750 [Sphaerisporangium melleum]|uniref:Uncharacterized protein n=1 Tax=Sphaerisporangium melleum TaxID=321316 RepID=A0A917VV98_9ACTN|nr:hypothetical protein GCM10007964_75140 [Sphaerisporangium melleum]GII74999.1 hypothetical protein Sme01_74750 [Sphaerisporangium melleum]